MAVNDNDLELLNTYLDGELPVSECEGLWRRLAAEHDLNAEMDRLRAESLLRRGAWSSYEPSDLDVLRLDANILRSSRRHDFFGTLNRYINMGLAAAACILFGVAIGWFQRDHFYGSSPSAGVTNNGGIVRNVAGDLGGSVPQPKYVVSVRNGAGKVIAVQQFNSIEEARKFANDITQSQANYQDAHDAPAVNEAANKF